MINILLLVPGSSKPLLPRVLERLRPLRAMDAQFVCVLGHEESHNHSSGTGIPLDDPAVRLIELNADTSGEACRALMAMEHINNIDPLIIMNGDHLLLDADLPALIREFQARALDGGLVVFEDNHSHRAYVKCDDQGLVVETAEKQLISHLASAGFNYFAKGSDFVLAATEMIKKDAHVGGVFYICPAYNELILRQRRVGIHQIPRQSNYPLANPVNLPDSPSN
jgi:dTDP-glucose pyrophosphorylase